MWSYLQKRYVQDSGALLHILMQKTHLIEQNDHFETALRGYGLAFHLTDDPPDARTDNRNASEIKTWKINDGKVMAAIVNSVKQSMIMSLSLPKLSGLIYRSVMFRIVVLFFISSCTQYI
jgi:hypothetical protein